MTGKNISAHTEFVAHLEVKAENGIHLGPAALLAKYAQKRKDLKIRFRKDGNEVPAASIMSILTLELTKGVAVDVVFSKEDEAGLQYIQSILDGKKEENGLEEKA